MFAGPSPKAVGSKKKSQPADSSAVPSAYPSSHHLLQLLCNLLRLTCYSCSQAADSLVESTKQGTDISVVTVGACSTAQKGFDSGCARL